MCIHAWGRFGQPEAKGEPRHIAPQTASAGQPEAKPVPTCRIQMTKVSWIAATALLLGIAAPPAGAATLFFDDFENGDIATGGPGTVNAGFSTTGDAGNPTGDFGIREEGGAAVLDVLDDDTNEDGRWSNQRMWSNNSFDGGAGSAIRFTVVVNSRA